ncbi:hypothetical protein F4677DRAFT_437244 [Hypoxylon crocopeplum]|nr:hypothetical protein F4677DRAFT_437244 [Hypoxylon crocopeplum]
MESNTVDEAGEPYHRDGWDYANDPTGAPIFDVPERKIVAIEHPSVLLDLDKGLTTFGPDPGFRKLLDAPETSSVPLWLRHDNPTSKPIASHHAATNSVLFKISVPKRTGRKRKRGSDEPFTGDVNAADGLDIASGTGQVGSINRHDAPKTILRKMQDNVDDYLAEAVGSIKSTHRYRGLGDFQFANVNNSFLTRTAENLLPMKVSKLRHIRFTPGVAADPGQEIIPPPHFTDRVVGFNYNYEQNPNTKVEGDDVGKKKLVNIQGRKMHSYGHFINHNERPVPHKPQRQPELPVPEELLNQLNALMEERPIWTRRAILNRVTTDYTDSVIKIALQLIAYQFRGGPWRDAFVKYGVDPRDDPKFRSYQTLAFKLESNIVGTKKTPWEVIRKSQWKKQLRENRSSHLWNGKDYSTDGKFWQVCDITDPFVLSIIDRAPLRTTCDVSDSGWYYKGTWTKIKLVMKVKMIAIKKGRMGSNSDSPQKLGYLYDSFLEEKLRQFPDKVDKVSGFTIDSFLRPLGEVDTRMHILRTSSQARKTKQKANEPATIEAPSTQGNDDSNMDSTVMPDGNGESPRNDEDVVSPDHSLDSGIIDGDLDNVEGAAGEYGGYDENYGGEDREEDEVEEDNSVEDAYD